MNYFYNKKDLKRLSEEVLELINNYSYTFSFAIKTVIDRNYKKISTSEWGNLRRGIISEIKLIKKEEKEREREVEIIIKRNKEIKELEIKIEKIKNFLNHISADNEYEGEHTKNELIKDLVKFSTMIKKLREEDIASEFKDNELKKNEEIKNSKKENNNQWGQLDIPFNIK